MELTAGASPRGADAFGSSVAINSNFAFVGAPLTGDAVGTVFVFALAEGSVSGGKLELQHVLHPPAINGTAVSAAAYFGISLGLSSNNLFVGAPGINGNIGAVFVFSLNGFVSVGRLTANDGHSNDMFGMNMLLLGCCCIVIVHFCMIGSLICFFVSRLCFQ